MANLYLIILSVYVDGCDLGDNEVGIGDTAEIPCPCQDHLHGLIDSQKATRHCSGSYRNGADLQDTDYSECVTITDNITNSLCHSLEV